MINSINGLCVLFSVSWLLCWKYVSCLCGCRSREVGVLRLGLMKPFEGRLFILNGQWPLKLIMQLLRSLPPSKLSAKQLVRTPLPLLEPAGKAAVVLAGLLAAGRFW